VALKFFFRSECPSQTMQPRSGRYRMKAQLTQGWMDNAIWIERAEREIREGFKENRGR